MIRFQQTLFYYINKLLMMVLYASLLVALPPQGSAQTTAKKNKSKILKTQKAIWLAHILRKKNPLNQIQQLDLKLNEIPVYMIPKGGRIRPLIKLKLNYKRKDWNLFYGEKLALKKHPNTDSYTVFAFLNARISEVPIVAIGPNGQIQREKLYIFAPEAREYQMVSPFDAILFHSGIAYTVYEQTSFGVFTSQSLFLGASYLSPESSSPWGLLADGYLTFYTYTSAPIDNNPQLYEARGAGSYRFQLHKDSVWRSRILLGINTVGLISHGSSFGFSGLTGITVGLHSDYFKTNNTTYGYEVGYSAYEGISLSDNRALSVQVSWSRNLNNLREFKAYFNWSNNVFTTGIENVSLDLVRLGCAITF